MSAISSSAAVKDLARSAAEGETKREYDGHVVQLGSNGWIEQITFSEDSMRGSVTVRLQDRDPKEDLVHVACWGLHDRAVVGV